MHLTVCGCSMTIHIQQSWLSLSNFEFHNFVDLLKNINDPEHPLTLEQLNVVQLGHIEANDANSYVSVYFTPTIPHCSMATLIGLSITVRLLRALPERFKVSSKYMQCLCLNICDTPELSI